MGGTNKMIDYDLCPFGTRRCSKSLAASDASCVAQGSSLIGPIRRNGIIRGVGTLPLHLAYLIAVIKISVLLGLPIFQFEHLPRASLV